MCCNCPSLLYYSSIEHNYKNETIISNEVFRKVGDMKWGMQMVSLVRTHEILGIFLLKELEQAYKQLVQLFQWWGMVRSIWQLACDVVWARRIVVDNSKASNKPNYLMQMSGQSTSFRHEPLSCAGPIAVDGVDHQWFLPFQQVAYQQPSQKNP